MAQELVLLSGPTIIIRETLPYLDVLRLLLRAGRHPDGVQPAATPPEVQEAPLTVAARVPHGRHGAQGGDQRGRGGEVQRGVGGGAAQAGLRSSKSSR